MTTHSDRPSPAPENQGRTTALIVGGAILAMLLIWTYIFFGMKGVSLWGFAIGLVVIALAAVFGWKWRRERIKKQLDVLDKWAEKESSRTAPTARRR